MLAFAPILVVALAATLARGNTVLLASGSASPLAVISARSCTNTASKNVSRPAPSHPHSDGRCGNPRSTVADRRAPN